MKSHRRLILAFAATFLLAGVFWLFWPPPRTAQSVTLTRRTNSRPQSSNTVEFFVTNSGPRAILLTDLIVEVPKQGGWQAFSHTTPTHPQRLAPGDTKELAAGAPGRAGPWRFRVTYGTDVKGPMLALDKVGFAVFENRLRLPGPGFGVMAGSNSLISAEIKN